MIRILLLCCTLWWVLPTVAVASVAADQAKRIFLLNSYSRQSEWSCELNDSLIDRLHHLHPEWSLYSGYLKTENAVVSSSTMLTLRSLLWGYAAHTRNTVPPTSLSFEHFFMQDDTPDALLIIGDEGFIIYQSLAYFLNAWERVPVVLCMVSDSIANRWDPLIPFEYDQMRPLVDTRTFNALVDDGRRKTVHFNLSGVTAPSNVRENLALIRKLMPDLKELIWVDDDHYTAKKKRLEVERLMPQMMPDVHYAAMIHNRENADSIYRVMLEPAPGRAFLTYRWNMDGMHSRYTYQQIDSLFTYQSTVPTFSLTRRSFESNNYYVGGYYYNMPDIVERTVGLITRAVTGADLNTMPFDTLQKGSIILNRTAVERYGLSSAARRLQQVTYRHIPPPFYRKYEVEVLVVLLFLAVVIVFVLITLHIIRYNRRLRGDYERYKRLYNKLQIIYDIGSIDFVLYDRRGKRLSPTRQQTSFCFNDDLFDSQYLLEEQKKELRNKHTVNCEITVENTPTNKSSRQATKTHYQVIIKQLDENTYHVAGFIAIAIDLTPVVQEQQERERYESLFRFASDSSQIGVVFYDINTAVGMATQSWCATMNDVFVSGTFPTYTHVDPLDREVLLAYQQEVRNGGVPEPFCREIRVTGKDNKVHWVRQHIYVVPKSARLIELSLNIDEQKRSEEALEEARQQAKRSNVETQVFLEEISHEVRTPLNAIIGFSAILAEINDDEFKKEFAPIIRKNVQLLNDLLSNILDLSALDGETVRFRPEWFSVPEMFRKLEKNILHNVYGKQLFVVMNLTDSVDDWLIHTDRKYLKLLMINLVSNAIKFTPSGGSITLDYHRNERKMYCFSVTDTGCGITPEKQQRIFERFYKIDSFVQGSGLGLSLCRSIVVHLGGKIEVESTPGEGSTFRVELPELATSN
ncbi:MAG: hypothetical protein LBN06_04990 [Prevotellaceae bacterium]|jgi:signal transduction histidine kinase|nr:hypothetical protein [Prevotellaceae bacterium]